MPDDHARAQQLIGAAAVEGLARADREWLEQHLANCETCGRLAGQTQRAIQKLRLVPVPLPPDLASRTQLRVYLRAQELQPRTRTWALWTAFAVSWVLGIASAPLVWHGFEWAGRLAGFPTLWLKFTFVLWWGVPAAIATGIWVAERRRIEEK